MNLQDRSALEDLKTFIILRKMKNSQDTEFGKDVVYQKASERIGQLKFQEIQAIQVKSQPLQSPLPKFSSILPVSAKPASVIHVV